MMTKTVGFMQQQSQDALATQTGCYSNATCKLKQAYNKSIDSMVAKHHSCNQLESFDAANHSF